MNSVLRLSKLHDTLVSGLLVDSETLTDAYLSCAVLLLNRVLRDHLTTQQFLQEIFGSQRHQQTPFFQTLYWALLRPWLRPASGGASSSYRHLEHYLKDLRQRSSRPEDAKLFDDFNTRVGSDVALRYAWECCLQALELLPRLEGWKHGAQIFQTLLRHSVKLPALPSLVPTEAKTAWGIIEIAASFGLNMYDYITGHPNAQWHAPIIDIQVTIHRALRDQLPLPLLYSALSYADRWQVFWAVTAANETVLCSPLSTYEQRRQAMGDPLDTPSSQQAGLFALISHWLSQPAYSGPECQAALTHTLRRLLDPQTPLAPWLRHNAYHAWEALKPRLTGERALYTKQEIEDNLLAKQNSAWAKLEAEARRQQAPFRSDRSLRRNSLVERIPEQMPQLQDRDYPQMGVSLRRQLYQQVQPVVETWPDEKQVTFHAAAAQAYQIQTVPDDPYSERIDTYVHLHRAVHAATQGELETATHRQQLLTHTLLTDLAQTYAELFTSSLQSHPPFGSLLPQSEKNARWAEDVHQALISYAQLLHPLLDFTQVLCEWQLPDIARSLWQPLAKTHHRYLDIYTDWGTWVDTLEAQTPEQLLWGSRCAARQEDYHRFETCCNAYGLAAFFYQQEIKEKPESLPLPSGSPWHKFNRRFKEKDYGGGKEDKYEKDCSSPLPWLTQIADWLNQRLPRPPCPFKPFVLPKTDGHFLLGIELTDSFYRHHPFFSHWAQWFKICVGLFSDFACTVNVSAVSHFGLERPSAIVLDGVGTHRELVGISEFKPDQDHWRYQTAPMIYLTPTPQRPLDLHGQLSPEDKTGLRPHTVALNRQWQRNLQALTTSMFDSKAPVARLQWPEAKEPRYLSAALTRRLFHTQGQSGGQRPVWRLTAADACQFLPEYTGDDILVYVKADPHHLWRQWQHLGLMQRLIDYGHTGTIASLQYGRIDEEKPDQFKPVGDPVPVWLSSPAGLTFCTLDESKDLSLTSDVQLLDETGRQRFAQSIAQLDPWYFTQAVFLTWVLVHEDDQLRNLGFEPLVNGQGEGAFRLIPFDTDTALEAPWIRLPDGRVQIKLKSLLFCLDAMQRPLDASAIRNFLALELETVLESWLTRLAEVKMVEVKMTQNRLPTECVDDLYLRWQRLRQVLTLPETASDRMSPVLPRSHLELLTLLDPVLGQAYQQAFITHTDSLQRFAAVSQDYVRVSGVSISPGSGLLRGESITQARTLASPISFGMTPQQALKRCAHYRRENQEIDPLLEYLTNQAKTTDAEANARFKIQMNAVVGEIQALNQKTQKQLEQQLRLKSDAEHTATYLSQWEPIAAPNLTVIILLPEAKTSLTLVEWQTNCFKTAKPGLWAIQDITKTWQIKIHNGQRLVVSDAEDSGWDLKPLYQALDRKPEPAAIRQSVRQIYLNQLQALQKIHLALQHSEITLKKLAQQRQTQLLRETKEIKAWYELPKNHDHFLLGLLETSLRQTVVDRLLWETLSLGKGLDQLLRLLEIGGLTTINLQGCKVVTDTHVTVLARNSPYLTTINLSGCQEITSLGLSHLAENAYLRRLSAGSLLKLTHLGRRNRFWSSRGIRMFPQLTHADFRGCHNLSYIHLQTPTLKYLHLGDCRALEGQGRSFNWTIIAPELQTLSIQNSTPISQLTIDSAALKHIDIREATSMTLSSLQAILTPERWAGVHTLQMTGCPALNEWKNLSHYPFLVPLAQNDINAKQLSDLHSIFSNPAIPVSVTTLSDSDRQRLQIGLNLFFNLQDHNILHTVIETIDHLDNQACRILATEIMGGIGTISATLAKEMLKSLLPMLENKEYVVCIAAIEAISRIVIANPGFSSEAIKIFFIALQNDLYYLIRKAAIQAIHKICATNPTLACELFKILLEQTMSIQKLIDPKFRSAITEILEAMITEESLLPIDEILKIILSELEDPDNDIRNKGILILILGGIGNCHSSITDTVLNTLSVMILDPQWQICCVSTEALQILSLKNPSLSEKVFTTLLTALEKNTSFVRAVVTATISKLKPSFISQQEFKNLVLLILNHSTQESKFLQSTIIKTLYSIAIGDMSRCNEMLKLLSETIKKTNSQTVYCIIIEVLSLIGVINSSLSKEILKILYLIESHGNNIEILIKVIEALGKIGASNSSLSEGIVNSLIKQLDYYHGNIDIRNAITKALGMIKFSSKYLSEKVLVNLMPGLNDQSRMIRQASREVIEKIIKVNPTLITSHFLKELTVLCNKKELLEKLEGFLLMVKISGEYQLYPGQTLLGFIYTFLQKVFTVPSIENFLGDYFIDKRPLPSPKKIQTLTLTTLGDDRSLAQNGQQRNYWYSISDLYLLTAQVRQQHLVYFFPNESKQEYKAPGEEHDSAYRQNQHGVFVADPYVQIGACRIPQFLTEDIAIITGTHEISSRCHCWTAMPRHLFFTFWHHAHWQLVGIEIDYPSATYLVRWDNPFGAMPLSSQDKDPFSEPFYVELTQSIEAAVQALFKAHRSVSTTMTSDSKLELKSVRQVKMLDQQGRGVNGYDCGPIVIQNLEDYVTHVSKDQPLAEFKDAQLTILAAGSETWEQKLIPVRRQHFEYAKKSVTTDHLLSTTDKRFTTQQTALLQQAQAKQQALTLTEAKSDSQVDILTQTISKLSTPQLGVLFAQIDYQRLLLEKSLDEPYSPMELQTSYELITATSGIPTGKSVDSPHTSIMAFFPSSSSSSSSSSSCSSSGSSSSNATPTSSSFQ